MAGVVVGGGYVPGVSGHIVASQGVIVQRNALGRKFFRKNRKPLFQPVNPERAKSAVTVIYQGVLVQGFVSGHNSHARARA